MPTTEVDESDEAENSDKGEDLDEPEGGADFTCGLEDHSGTGGIEDDLSEMQVDPNSMIQGGATSRMTEVHLQAKSSKRCTMVSPPW